MYYALGGYSLPPDDQEKLLELISEAPQTDDVSAAVTNALRADPMALTTGSDALVQAVIAAGEALLGLDAGSTAPGGSPARVGTGADQFTILNITPRDAEASDAEQSGVQLQQNPDGAGVVAQNSFRRGAAILSYKTGYEDDSGTFHETAPPERLGDLVPVEPATRLGLFTSIGGVFGGSTPLTAHTTPPLLLPADPDARKTFYEVVLLGPSLDFVSPVPILTDPRFSGQTAEWEQIMEDMAIDLFVEEVGMPVLETFALGGVATGLQQNRAAAVAKFQMQLKAHQDVTFRHIMRQGPGYAEAHRWIYGNPNGPYRTDLLDIVETRLGEQAKLQADFDAIDKRLKSRASAATILAVLDALFRTADLTKLLYDLQHSAWAESWEVEAILPRVRILPDPAGVTATERSVLLTGSVDGFPDGDFVFAWETTTENGNITADDGTEGPMIVLSGSNSSVRYTASTALIPKGEIDHVTLEVSTLLTEEVEPIGEVTIPIMGPESSYEVSLVPEHAFVTSSDAVEIRAVLEPEFEGTGLLYVWNTTGNYGFLFPTAGTMTGLDAVTYNADVGAEGVDNLFVEVFDETLESLGTGSGTVEVVAPDPVMYTGIWHTDQEFFTDPGGNERVCGAAYISFPLTEGAVRYEMHAHSFNDTLFWGTMIDRGFVEPFAAADTSPCHFVAGSDGSSYHFFLTGGTGGAHLAASQLAGFNARFGGMQVDIIAHFR